MRAAHNRHPHRNIQAHLCIRYFLHIFLCCSVVCAISLTKHRKHHGRNFAVKYMLKKTSFEEKNQLAVFPPLVYQSVAIDEVLMYSAGHLSAYQVSRPIKSQNCFRRKWREISSSKLNFVEQTFR